MKLHMIEWSGTVKMLTISVVMYLFPPLMHRDLSSTQKAIPLISSSVDLITWHSARRGGIVPSRCRFLDRIWFAPLGAGVLQLKHSIHKDIAETNLQIADPTVSMFVHQVAVLLEIKLYLLRSSLIMIVEDLRVNVLHDCSLSNLMLSELNWSHTETPPTIGNTCIDLIHLKISMNPVWFSSCSQRSRNVSITKKTFKSKVHLSFHGRLWQVMRWQINKTIWDTRLSVRLGRSQRIITVHFKLIAVPPTQQHINFTCNWLSLDWPWRVRISLNNSGNSFELPLFRNYQLLYKLFIFDSSNGVVTF